jgi:hypothetical protein
MKDEVLGGMCKRSKGFEIKCNNVGVSLEKHTSLEGVELIRAKLNLIIVPQMHPMTQQHIVKSSTQILTY